MTGGTASAIPKRFIVVAMCFAAMLICYLDRVSMSTAVIPMAAEFGWSATTKGWVLSSFFIGYMLVQIPGSWITNRYGGRIVLGFSLIAWSVITLLTPLAAMSSLTLLIIARVAMGVGEASVAPCLYNLAARWLPPHERSRGMTVMIGGIPMGTVAALLASGWLLQTYAWPVMFYLFGTIGLIFSVAWFRLIHASPARHPRIGAAELALLEDRDAAPGAATPKVPWGRLLRTPATWALISNHFCSNWALYVLLSWLPTYFNAFKELGIGSAGLFSAAPFVLLFVTGNVAAVIADRMIRRGFSLTAVRKTMQIVGLLGSAVFLIWASQVQSAGAALFTLCAALGMLGFTWSGFGPNHLDIAPRYADVLAGFTNTAGTLPGVIGVVITGWLIDMTGSFSSAFQLAAAVNVVGAIIWAIWSTGKKVID